MRELNGWWMPDDNRYFDKFFEGIAPKKNGFQREHLERAFEYVKKWDYAIDVGAHVGFWAKDMADRFKKVYCFEPVRDNFMCLVKNLAMYENVMISPLAIGKSVDVVTMARDDRRWNSGSDYVKVDSNGTIKMVPLDKLNLPGCDLLKIDVEGFELPVLRGAKELLEKYKPVVIMECNKHFSKRRYSWDANASQSFLIKRGYKEVAYMRPDKIFVYGDK